MIIKRYKKTYIKLEKFNEVENMENITRYCSVEESLEVSLRQMQSIKNGILPKKTWKDFCVELEKEED